MARPSQKLSHKRLGPFTIVRKVRNGVYWLHLPPSMSRLHPVFNIIKLTLAPEDPIQGQHLQPPSTSWNHRWGRRMGSRRNPWQQSSQPETAISCQMGRIQNWTPQSTLTHLDYRLQEYHVLSQSTISSTGSSLPWRGGRCQRTPFKSHSYHKVRQFHSHSRSLYSPTL